MQTVPGSAESGCSSESKDNISLCATQNGLLVSLVKPQVHLWSIPLKGELLTVNIGDLPRITESWHVRDMTLTDEDQNPGMFNLEIYFHVTAIIQYSRISLSDMYL